MSHEIFLFSYSFFPRTSETELKASNNQILLASIVYFLFANFYRVVGSFFLHYIRHDDVLFGAEMMTMIYSVDEEEMQTLYFIL